MQFASSYPSFGNATCGRVQRPGLKLGAFALFTVAGVSLALAAPTAGAESLSRSVVVQGAPPLVWPMIGPFCAIEKWLPPVGSCKEDGAVPPTRTLVTKDGSATFVERETARSETEHSYSYAFLSSPLPVSGYVSTIQVRASGPSQSTVTWHGTYTPEAGKEKDAEAALDAIYVAGLESIKNQAEQQFAPVAAK